jgi:hypothetical protein
MPPSDRRIACNHDAMHAAALARMVVERVVLGKDSCWQGTQDMLGASLKARVLLDWCERGRVVVYIIL